MSSSRARFDPRQRWMPSPNATWRFLPVDLELVGVLERFGVVIGCREGEQHLVAGVHRAARHLGVFDDLATHRDGGVEAQHFFGRRSPQQVAVVGCDERRTLVGILAEVPQARPDRTPRGVDAGDDHQADVALLELHLDGLAVDLGVGDQGEQVVLRLRHALRQQVLVIGVHLLLHLELHGVVARARSGTTGRASLGTCRRRSREHRAVGRCRGPGCVGSIARRRRRGWRRRARRSGRDRTHVDRPPSVRSPWG